jgi:hypothetical protein
MRRFLVLSLAWSLGGCIDSPVDLSATIPPASPLAEGFYQPTDDPKAPAFQIIKSGADYRAVDPEKSDATGAVFALMDPDKTGFFIAEDKTGANDPGERHYAYYFVRVSPASDSVDLYDLTEKDLRLLPAALRKRFVLDAGVKLAQDSDTEAALRALDQWLSHGPALKRTRFRLVRKTGGEGH